MSSDYDINELLDLLENRDTLKTSKGKKAPKNKNVLDFIEHYGIEKGDVLVPNYMIYYVYRRDWNGRNQTNKLNKRAFFQTFGSLFESKRKTRFRGYMLNDCFGITKEKLEIANKYDKSVEKLRDTRRQTKKEKKKQERLSEKLITTEAVHNKKT